MSDPTDPASYSGLADQSEDTPAAAPPLDQPSTTWAEALPPVGPGWGGPSAAPPASAPAPLLITIGDIAVTQYHVVTPNGTHPLNRTSWFVTDQSTYSETTPTYAVVLAVTTFFFLCFFGLLFLLIKETKAMGFVQVTVQGPGWSHATQLPAGSGAAANHQVAYVRNLVAALG